MSKKLSKGSCFHAPEWITVTFAIHVIHHLIGGPKLLFVFIIISCLSLDGYEFTYTLY